MSATEESLLREILARLAAIEAQLAADGDARLTEAERHVLEALGGGKLAGEELAPKAGYPFNSNFKNTLSSLVKRGLLVNDRPGYRRPQSGLGQD